MANILLIGSGAREHAIAKCIRANNYSPLHVFGNNVNPGIQQLCNKYQVGDLNNINDIVQFARQNNIDFAIVGPEAPLELGVVDALKAQNIPAIGPTKQLAQIETSKGFARDLLTKYNIPASPKYRYFQNMDGVKEFLQELGADFVVKADGLMGGKGVKISGEHLFSHKDALNYCKELDSFVIEEKLIGQEFSLLSFSDGEHLAHMPAVQDHKRAFENDTGPNTGGMGSYSDANHLLPFLNEADIQQAQTINEATIKALNQEYGPYKGILYGGFMLTPRGVKLIEFNARFGDPEAINLLALLETDLVKICEAIINGTLDQIEVKFAHKATVCKYAVPEGYPDNPIKNQEIIVPNNEQIYYAAVNAENGKLYETGSRTIATLGIADNIPTAEAIAEHLIQQIKGPLFHRKDIGTATLINKKIAVLASGRGTVLDKILAAGINIEIIITNKENAPVLQKAEKHHIKSKYIPLGDNTREQHEQLITKELQQHDIDLILLIGYMRILSPTFVNTWRHKILNVHPSLLPAFAGLMDLQIHKAVLEAGVKETGCTVHYVTEELDGGPIVVQKKCKVENNDTPETLKTRVQELEGDAFIEAIKKHQLPCN